MKAIQFKKIKKHFGKVKAVDGISIDIKKGEIFGFLGPNGAGKTTTIRCMMDFIRPNSGSITLLGLDSKKDSVELKNKIGYLAPEPRLYDNLSGREHFQLIEKIRGKGEKKDELVRKLSADIDQKIKTLSTGNKQKISLIIALMHNPEIVIMDEPTAGLDPLLQNTIYERLLEMKDEGKTIFMSSHNLSEVEKICGRAAIIRKGKLIAVEDIKKLNSKRLYKVWVLSKNVEDLKDLKKIKGVEIETESNSEIYLKVVGRIDPIVKYFANKEIDDIRIEHAGLEETFLNFYKKQ